MNKKKCRAQVRVRLWVNFWVTIMFWFRVRLRARARVRAWWIVKWRLKSNHFSKNYELTSICKQLTLLFEFMKIILMQLARFSTWQIFSTWRFFAKWKNLANWKNLQSGIVKFSLDAKRNNHFLIKNIITDVFLIVVFTIPWKLIFIFQLFFANLCSETKKCRIEVSNWFL